jgi:hypothetical protein
MTVVVVIFLPSVLAYQAWTLYVFRRRIGKQEFGRRRHLSPLWVMPWGSGRGLLERRPGRRG